ncbi:MAG: CYTH domain-containing protein [Acidimicrobiales bacterium]
MTTAVEREVKLSAPDGFELPDLSVVDDVGTVDRDTIELDALYVDTAELDLIRRGASLRRRREPAGTVWTLKLPNELGQPEPGSSRAALLERRELDVHDDGEAVPASLAAVVVPWVRDRSLVPVAACTRCAAGTASSAPPASCWPKPPTTTSRCGTPPTPRRRSHPSASSRSKPDPRSRSRSGWPRSPARSRSSSAGAGLSPP